MANLFEPTDPIASFDPPEGEFHVTVEPKGDQAELTEASEPEEPAIRFFSWPSLVFALMLGILAFRLVNLQITQGKLFQVLAQGNRAETKTIVSPRGVIVDRAGRALLKNSPVYNLELFLAKLPKTKEDREAIYRQISQVTGMAPNLIGESVSSQGLRSLTPVLLKENIERDTALDWSVKLGALSGVAMTQFPVRSYETIPGLSHLLGYVGQLTKEEQAKRPELRATALIGKTGLEATYDSYLQGQDGKEEVEVDSKGQIQRIISSEPALPGQTLELYLDKELQQVVAEALGEGIKASGSKKGSVIALDPRTGGVLAMVSLPSYDNNSFVQRPRDKERQAFLQDKDQPLFNRAIAGLYPPGSTSKPVWAIAGLEEKMISERTVLKTPPEIRIGESVFPDWKPHGSADIKQALAESNNIFFYALGGGYDKIKGLGPNKMKEYASRFGWGEPTGIDLPGEKGGLVPDPGWKKEKRKEGWYVGDSYHLAIGQGDLLVSPLQLANAVAAIANSGTLYQPQLVRRINDTNDRLVTDFPGHILRKNVASSESLRIVREGMRQTVTAGTARPLGDIPLAIAGKTGTAQFEEQGKTHAWFVGFAPYDHPTIVLSVMVERGGDSFATAIPIAKKIFTWYSERDFPPS